MPTICHIPTTCNPQHSSLTGSEHFRLPTLSVTSEENGRCLNMVTGSDVRLDGLISLVGNQQTEQLSLAFTFTHWPRSQHLLHMDAVTGPAVTSKITPLALIQEFQAVSRKWRVEPKQQHQKPAHVDGEGSTRVSPFTQRSGQSYTQQRRKCPRVARRSRGELRRSWHLIWGASPGWRSSPQLAVFPCPGSAVGRSAGRSVCFVCVCVFVQGEARVWRTTVTSPTYPAVEGR